jgi:RND family efflux transporter MFP subunit
LVFLVESTEYFIFMEKKKKRLNWKKLGIAVGIVVLIVAVLQFFAPEKEIEPVAAEISIKKVRVIEFGAWDPDAQREILGTIESGTNVDISAEISGTIEKVSVNIGDSVVAGQVLAQFRKTNDSTQIAYENAIQNLNVVRISTQNSVRSAEIALETAEQELAQTRTKESQTYSQTFDTLRTSARNAETTFENALDWADRILQGSNKFRFEMDSVGILIGSNDSVKKQSAKNLAQKLSQTAAEFSSSTRGFEMTDSEILNYAEHRLELLSATQNLLRTTDELIRGTPITSRFSSANRSTYQTQVETQKSAVDAVILSLQTQIESAKTEQARNGLSVLTAENKVRSAEAALELAQATASSQVSTAQSQLRVTQKSQSDLSVRAPFSGKISAKMINGYDRVSQGQTLFSLVGNDVKPKIVATVTRDELEKMQHASERIFVRFANGQIENLPEFQMSGTIDSLTQKVEIEFPLETLSEGSLVGSFVRIQLPLRNGVSNLVPISAISFEPGGAEVLTIDEENIVRRQEIETGKIISDAIEVLSGLENGASVILFRNRTHAGESVEIQQ